MFPDLSYGLDQRSGLQLKVYLSDVSCQLALLH